MFCVLFIVLVFEIVFAKSNNFELLSTIFSARNAVEVVVIEVTSACVINKSISTICSKLLKNTTLPGHCFISSKVIAFVMRYAWHKTFWFEWLYFSFSILWHKCPYLLVGKWRPLYNMCSIVVVSQNLLVYFKLFPGKIVWGLRLITYTILNKNPNFYFLSCLFTFLI